MGCLKLTYRAETLGLKVVKSNLKVNQKSSAGHYVFGFNGMEKDDDIDGVSGSKLDFGARIYDSRLGRWLSTDAFENETPSWTPYRFGFDNPIFWLDSDGNREFASYKAYVKYATANNIKILSEFEMYKQGNWLWIHRIRYQEGTANEKERQAVFANAAAINTTNLASSEYVNLNERQAYYGWANNFFTNKGFEIKWMGAAESTVATLSLALLPPASWLGFSNNEIKKFINDGNKLILDDMISRIDNLTSIYKDKGPLKGADALKWDAQTLSDEQNLIQPLYESLSPESVAILQENLELTYGFQGDVLNPADRWKFGMEQMGYETTSDQMPEAGGDYECVDVKVK